MVKRIIMSVEPGREKYDRANARHCFGKNSFPCRNAVSVTPTSAVGRGEKSTGPDREGGINVQARTGDKRMTEGEPIWKKNTHTGEAQKERRKDEAARGAGPRIKLHPRCRVRKKRKS